MAGKPRRRLRYRDHKTVRRFFEVVSRCGPQGGARRLLAGEGLHGDPAVRLRDLGTDPAAARSALQGDRPRQRLLSAADPREPVAEGGGARRRLRAAGGLGHQGRHRGSRREADHPADVGNDLRRDVPEVDPVVARSARADQPVVQRRSLGESDAAIPAHDRIPVAGRSHRARDRGRSAGRDDEDPRHLQGVCRERPRHAGRRRPEERERKVRRRVTHVFDRGADGRRPRAAGGHVAQPRAELRQGVRDPVPGP